MDYMTLIANLDEVGYSLTTCEEYLNAKYSDAPSIPYAYWQSKSAINEAMQMLEDAEARKFDDFDVFAFINLMDNVERELSYLPHKDKSLRKYRMVFAKYIHELTE